VTERVVDCRGRRCPLPIIDLARAIGTVAVGDLVVVEADDPAAAADIAAWCRMRKHELGAADRAADGTPRYPVRRLH
jgi:TusA-related sulfurtransferase